MDENWKEQTMPLILAPSTSVMVSMKREGKQMELSVTRA